MAGGDAPPAASHIPHLGGRGCRKHDDARVGSGVALLDFGSVRDFAAQRSAHPQSRLLRRQGESALCNALGKGCVAARVPPRVLFRRADVIGTRTQNLPPDAWARCSPCHKRRLRAAPRTFGFVCLLARFIFYRNKGVLVLLALLYYLLFYPPCSCRDGMHPCARRGRPHKWRGPQNLCASRCRRGALRLRRPNEKKKQPPVTSKANNYSDDRAMMRTGRLVATNSTLHPPFCCCCPCVRKRRADAYDALFAIPVSYSFGYVVVLFEPAACAYWGGRRGLEGRTATFTRFFHRQPWPYFVRGIIDHGSQKSVGEIRSNEG